MENKKGFTLMELLAVIVVLSILMLVAGTSVMNVLEDAKKDNFVNEFLGLLETAQLRANTLRLNNELTSKNPSKCISIDDLTSSGYFNNPRGYKGSVKLELVTQDKKTTLKVTGWMSNDDYTIAGGDASAKRDSVTSTTEDASSSCGA